MWPSIPRVIRNLRPFLLQKNRRTLAGYLQLNETDRCRRCHMMMGICNGTIPSNSRKSPVICFAHTRYCLRLQRYGVKPIVHKSYKGGHCTPDDKSSARPSNIPTCRHYTARISSLHRNNVLVTTSSVAAIMDFTNFLVSTLIVHGE